MESGKPSTLNGDYSGAREALKEFLAAWKRKDKTTMWNRTGLTYRAKSHESSLDHLTSDPPVKYSVRDSWVNGDALICFVVRLTWPEHSPERTGEYRVNVICEQAPFQASTMGKWGVVPNSIRQEF